MFVTVTVDARPATERAPAIDVLRGLALFGVLLVNIETQFRVSPFDVFVAASSGVADGGVALARAPIDALTEAVVRSALQSKPLVLLSFLFGAGLAAQRGRLPPSRFSGVAVRRLVFLFLLGVAHYVLLWSGDVLALYAIVASIAALVVGRSTRTLLALSCASFVVQVLPLPYPTPFATFEVMASHAEAAHHVYGHGRYLDVLAFRFEELGPVLALSGWSIPRTFGLFLLGAVTWRPLMAPSSSHTRCLWLVAITGVGVGSLAAVSTPHARGVALALSTSTGEVGLALGGAAAAWIALERPRVGAALRWLAPIGKMTLTSYLMQSLVLSFVFYGYGFGLFGRMTAARGAALGIALFVAQAAFAAWWLRRYRFGPVEWLWRSFTYAAWQPMRERTGK